MHSLRILGNIAFWMGLASSVAQAQTEWNFSGFASLGAGRINSGSLTFFDYNDKWSFDSDSIVGLQAIALASDQFSATGQIIAKGFTFDGKPSYQPKLNWLFASYEATPSLRIRAGRLRTPLFLYSESLETGLSYPWVRPPVEMYAHFLEPFASVDGIDTTWNGALHGHDTEFTFLAGSTHNKYRSRNIDIPKAFAFTAQTQLSSLKLRYCYNWNRLTIENPDFESLAEIYHNIATLTHEDIFNRIANRARLDNQVFQYHAIGLQWERDAFFWVLEKFQTVGPRRQYSFENKGWYTSFGQQLGNFLPYVTVGEYINEMNPQIRQELLDSYEVFPASENNDSAIDRLREFTLDGISLLNVSQASIAVGVRYDINRHSALKAEAEYFDFNPRGQMTISGNGDYPNHAIATTIVYDMVF